MNDAKVGVVTITYNSAILLDDFLKSLDRQEFTNWHTYIIDNDSKDRTVALLHERNLDPAFYSVVTNKDNVGVAAGNNQGILLSLDAGCDWILLINNDTVFPPPLLGHLVQTAKAKNWRVVVPKIHFNIPPNAIWYAGGGFDHFKGHTGYHLGIAQADAGQFDQQKTVEYSPTCCMLIHKSVFAEIGLMDESYFAYFDDTDFCWRLKQAGIVIGYAPEQVLIHKVGGSTGGTTSAFFARLTARNRLYFLRKHFAPSAPARWLMLFVPYYVFRYLVKTWNPVAFRAAIEGTLAYRDMAEKTPQLPIQHRLAALATARARSTEP
jgi:GT2 family glycosyltransferase